jgi:hypothetical protein
MAADERRSTQIRINHVFCWFGSGREAGPHAVVVVERVENRPAFAGTPYPAVVERVRKIVRSDDLYHGRW